MGRSSNSRLLFWPFHSSVGLYKDVPSGAGLGLQEKDLSTLLFGPIAFHSGVSPLRAGTS